jgi:murein DD-endopeptidase MepM/ murein hydrolase activator NlpD
MAGVAAWIQQSGMESLRDLAQLFYRTPHERYETSLRRTGSADTPAGRSWLDSSVNSLATAAEVRLPQRQQMSFEAGRPEAAAFAVFLHRGQRYIAQTTIEGTERTRVFVDLFERDGDTFSHVVSAPDDELGVMFDIHSDGDHVVRVQPELERNVHVTLTLRTEPTLRLPVDHATPSSILSFFGAPRDGGHRDHHGVDIFARRGTSVIAAADGIVSKVGTNGLGGNVVWVVRPLRGERHYYAHLERQLVTAGTFVKAGDVIGTVGNTGNARTTAPHLHFGIYAAGHGAVDPLPYLSTPRVARVRAKEGHQRMTARTVNVRMSSAVSSWTSLRWPPRLLPPAVPSTKTTGVISRLSLALRFAPWSARN